MTQFLIFGANAGNGNIEYHIRKIHNPKPHQLRQALAYFNSYNEASEYKNNIRTPRSFQKPY